jgi:hypothetical protein
MAALEPVVVMVRVEVAAGLAGVTVPGLKLLALQAGAGDPDPLTLQLRLTDELYPFSEVKLTVEVPLLPGDTAAGAVAAIAKSGAVAGP